MNHFCLKNYSWEGSARADSVATTDKLKVDFKISPSSFIYLRNPIYLLPTIRTYVILSMSPMFNP